MNKSCNEHVELYMYTYSTEHQSASTSGVVKAVSRQCQSHVVEPDFECLESLTLPGCTFNNQHCPCSTI